MLIGGLLVGMVVYTISMKGLEIEGVPVFRKCHYLSCARELELFAGKFRGSTSREALW